MSKQNTEAFRESAIGCGITLAFFFAIGMILVMGGKESDPSTDDATAIVHAKEVVKSQLNYPDTASFDMFYTEVTPTHVHLKVTAKNGFGVPETHTFKIPR